MDEKTKNKDLTICGFNSVDALVSKNPQKVKRFFFNKESAARFGDFCKTLAVDKKVYRMVSDDELQKISGSFGHQGVVAVVDMPVFKQADEMLLIKLQSEKEPILFLDIIASPQSLGAVCRNAAYFGIKQIIVLATDPQAKASTAAYRVAEGSMEYVNFHQVRPENLAEFISIAKRYYVVLGTTLKKATPISELKEIMPSDKLPFLVLGNEDKPISLQMEVLCDLVVNIAGSGQVESMNISATSAVLFNCLKNL